MGVSPFCPFLGTPIKWGFSYFFYDFSYFMGVGNFFYSTPNRHFPFFRHKIDWFWGVKCENTLFFGFFHLIFRSKTYRIMYVFSIFFVKKCDFQSHFSSYFTLINRWFLTSKYGFFDFRGEENRHFFTTPIKPHFPCFFRGFYVFI